MFQRPRLLLVDNDEAFLKSLEATARRRCLVRTATNVKDALKSVRTFTPDLIICEIELDETNGTELLEEIRCDSRTQNLPFIFLTKNAELTNVKLAKTYRVTNYILKNSFELNDLLMLIAIALNRMDMITEE